MWLGISFSLFRLPPPLLCATESPALVYQPDSKVFISVDASVIQEIWFEIEFPWSLDRFGFTSIPCSCATISSAISLWPRAGWGLSEHMIDLLVCWGGPGTHRGNSSVGSCLVRFKEIAGV
ncbi:hypothetical protein LINPERPRIM_LOCUS11872 [Linum perenne]